MRVTFETTSTVLSAETVEQEHHWLNYEYEEAQVKIDLSDMILEHLVDELASFLNEKSGLPTPMKSIEAANAPNSEYRSKDSGIPSAASKIIGSAERAAAFTAEDLTAAAGGPPSSGIEMYELMRDEPEFANSGSKAHEQPSLK